MYGLELRKRTSKRICRSFFVCDESCKRDKGRKRSKSKKEREWRDREISNNHSIIYTCEKLRVIIFMLILLILIVANQRTTLGLAKLVWFENLPQVQWSYIPNNFN